MTQIDVVLTDYALTVECTLFAWLLVRRGKSASQVERWFTIFFLAIAVAAATGGTVHGFFSGRPSLGYQVLWRITLIVVGIAALAGVRVGTALEFAGVSASLINRVAMGAFFVYGIVVCWISQDFLVAVVGYLPAVIFLGLVFFVIYRRENNRSFLIGFLGVCTTLMAAGIQQARVDISPRYFSYNALYHVIQGVGLYLIFVPAWERSKHHDSTLANVPYSTFLS